MVRPNIWLKRRQIYTIWTNNFLPLWFCPIAWFFLSRSTRTKLNLFHSSSLSYRRWKHWTILLHDCGEHCPSACEGLMFRNLLWLPATGKWAQNNLVVYFSSFRSNVRVWDYHAALICVRLSISTFEPVDRFSWKFAWELFHFRWLGRHQF
jgi:hypothetical protein